MSTEVRTWLINPGVPIPEEASAIHGISTEHALTHGEAPGPALEEIASLITADLELGVPVVAFNAAFDLSLLDAELARHALRTLGERLGREVTPVVDPLVLDRSLDRYRKGKRKLGDLCAHYGVFDGGNLHTADVDVLATLDVLEAMTRAFRRSWTRTWTRSTATRSPRTAPGRRTSTPGACSRATPAWGEHRLALLTCTEDPSNSWNI
ncbi:exonuclease domain-containing protein [Oerskovia sp. M15]